jgi:hypothetical protein
MATRGDGEVIELTPPRSKAAVALYIAATFSVLSQIASTLVTLAAMQQTPWWFVATKLLFGWVLPMVLIVCASVAQKISDIHWMLSQKAGKPNA